MKFDPPIPRLAPNQADASPRFRFTLEEGAFAGQAFTATLFICPNPCCGCEGVRFDCQRDADDRGTVDPGLVSPAPRRVDLSVMQRAVHARPEATPEDLALAGAIVAEMQPADWAQWVQVFLNAKRGQMETMDIGTVEAWFPPEVLAGRATMVGYSEVFPWAESFEFMLGAEWWLADDVYCVDPDCDCRGTVLEFFRSIRALERRKRSERCDSVLKHDYVRGRTTQLERKPRSPALTELMAGLRAAYPGFEPICRERHRKLKRLSARLRAAEVSASRRGAQALTEIDAAEPPSAPSAPPVKAAPKVGRNDLCPCGSGKKFKKCCGQ